MPPLHSEIIHEGYLTGQLLVAMPQMDDPRFDRTVIYICVHNADGAMGLVVNRLVNGMQFDDLLQQLNIPISGRGDLKIHFGGPVEGSRGFVLHTLDYQQDMTLETSTGIGMTATVDILKAIAEGEGPKKAMLTLGYASWGPGQLDAEMQQNSWIIVNSDESLVFDTAIDRKWERAMAKLGVSIGALSGETGHA
jgi:putative transcriptional regulator